MALLIVSCKTSPDEPVYSDDFAEEEYFIMQDIMAISYEIARTRESYDTVVFSEINNYEENLPSGEKNPNYSPNGYCNESNSVTYPYKVRWQMTSGGLKYFVIAANEKSGISGYEKTVVNYYNDDGTKLKVSDYNENESYACELKQDVDILIPYQTESETGKDGTYIFKMNANIKLQKDGVTCDSVTGTATLNNTHVKLTEEIFKKLSTKS